MSGLAEVAKVPSFQRDHLAQALIAITPMHGRNVTLYPHQYRALVKELGRLANLATLLGSPSPAEMAGLDERGHDIECDGTVGCKARKHVRCASAGSAAAP